MIFLSKWPGHKFFAIGQQVEPMPMGPPKVLHPGYVCRFKLQGLADWEYEAAKKAFTFSGMVTEEDGTPIDPIPQRVSTFNTEWVPEQFRSEVEQVMLKNVGPDFILAEKPREPIPWPTYDQVRGGGRGITTAAAIAERVTDLGLNPERVIAYERENQNRSDVIKALEQISAAVEDEEIVAA